ncbi:condensation domain-containing protein, partial [Kitasatospora sp. NPDC054939]
MSSGNDNGRPQEQDAAQRREELLRRRLGGAGGRKGRRGAGRAAFPTADRSAPLRTSHGQQQMWFLNRMHPDSPEYLVPLVLRMRGPLDAELLRRAVEGILDRHEVLRSRYVLADGEPVQVVDAPRRVELPLTDLRAVPSGEREERARGIVEADVARAIDLEQEWPVRALLVRLDEQDHILAVTFHHIACDAWSVRLFADELGTLYRAFGEGAASPLAPLAVQYADYAAWQRDHLSGEVMERHLAYWREQLADLPTLAVPTDRQRPAVREWAGGQVPFAVPAGLAARVGELAKAYDTTVFTVLLTAYQALLSRWSGGTDVPVGVTVSGRGRPELQQLIGYGINTLVVRGRWESGASFEELVAGTGRTLLDAFEYQAVPFAHLVDELQPERDLSRTPLFQVDFILQQDRATAFDLPGLDVEVLTGSRTSKFDLTMELLEGADGSLTGTLVFAAALFEHATVERLAGQFLQLLESVTAEPAAPVALAQLLPAAELELLTGAWATAVEAPVDATVHEVFERQVAATPDAVAVVFDGVELTYAEVNERANRLAHHLRSLGAGPEGLVGLSLERGLELLPALIGVLKSGAAYVPLDPSNPLDRLEYILADTGASVVVTQESLAHRFEAYRGDLVVLDRAETVDALAGASATDPAVLAGPESLIYVIYTSGSTGRPKGVCLSHANVLRLFTTTREQFGFGSDDVWTLFHSYAFDVSVWEMWGALLHGGRIVVVPAAVTRAPEEFVGLMVEHGATVLCQTPTAFRTLAQMAGAGDARVDALSLRAVIFAGERLDMGELAPWAARVGVDETALVNMYGITETTVHSTYYRVTAEDLAHASASP